jgi:hypothetical protein
VSLGLDLDLAAFFGFSALVVPEEEGLVAPCGIGAEAGAGAEAVAGEEGQSRDQWPGRPHL